MGHSESLSGPIDGSELDGRRETLNVHDGGVPELLFSTFIGSKSDPACSVIV